MYPVTDAVKALYAAEQPQVLRITGTDKNGVSINITDANVVLGSFNIDRYSCNGNRLEVGTAIAAEMTVKLDNHAGTYNGVVFEGTELYVEIGIGNPVNWMPCGYFTPDEQPRTANQITIHALDRMVKFDNSVPGLLPLENENHEIITDEQDQPSYFVTDLSYPATVQSIIQTVCGYYNVPFTQDISGLPNYNFTISEAPNLRQPTTYRNIIQWCAGIMGTCAWIDWTGSLRFSWYGEATGYVCTPANRFSSDLHEDDVEITGVQYTNLQNYTILAGQPEYTIDMTGNYLMAGGVTQILTSVNNALNGYTYRPFSASIINAPYLWPMDAITFTDKDGNDHTCVLTNVNFGINGAMAIEGKGESMASARRDALSGMTKEQGVIVEQAREATQQLDDSLTQEEIFNRLTDNGAAQGLVLYNGELYINASYINAGYMSANHIQGGTLTLGGANNVNGVLNFLDANGNLIGVWDNNGIQLNKGSLTFPVANGVAEGYISLNYQNITPMKVSMTSLNSTPATYEFTFDNFGISYMAMQTGDKFYISPKYVALEDHSGSNPSSHIIVTDRTGANGETVGYIELRGHDSRKLVVSKLNSGVATDVAYITDIGSMYLDGNLNVNGSIYVTNPLGITSGGTGATTAADARMNLGVKATQAVVSDPTAIGTSLTFIDSISQDAQGVIIPTKKTVQSASQSVAGIMSAADKKKLDGIASGAQVNSITGVKGNAEGSYRTGNVNLTTANIGAVALAGDTMTGDLLFSNSGTTIRQIRGTVGDNDYWRIAGGATAANGGWMEIATADDGTEPIYVRQYTGTYATVARTLTLLDASGNTTFPGTVIWGSNGAGGQLNGAATNGGINSIRVGDDVWLGDCNAAGIMGMKSTSTNCGFYMYNSSGTQIGQLYFDGTNLVCNKNINANILGNAATATAAQSTTFAVKAPHPWPAIELGTNSATHSDYTSPGNATWVMLYSTCPVVRKSDNYRYAVNFFVREYSHNGSGTRLNYYEDYYLPNCDISRTNTASYNILTTKSAVTVPQGGTGATSASGARSNLGIKSETLSNLSLTSDKNYDLGNNYAITSRTVIAVGCTSSTVSVVPYINNSHWWLAVRKLSDFTTPSTVSSVTVTITYIQL